MDSLASFSEDNISGLLESPSVEYSNVTLRRAYEIWKQSGQKNRFMDVCNYFHHLEALDLNLQSIRRELIAMLDDSENIYCTSCKQLKCCCIESKPCSERNSQSSHSKQDLNTSAGTDFSFVSNKLATATPKKSNAYTYF